MAKGYYNIWILKTQGGLKILFNEWTFMFHLLQENARFCLEQGTAFTGIPNDLLVQEIEINIIIK